MQDLTNDLRLDDERCFEAAVARDHRFDGRFFTAVRTTQLYCRPICPGRAKRKNVEFFRHAADAEAAGYRPCLRCRPEDAPRNPPSEMCAGPIQADAGVNGRLDFSRKLVVETGLPLVTIARISAFPSLEDFEKAFAVRFRRPPSFLRRFRKEDAGRELEFMLPFRPPLEWQTLLDFYRYHLIHGLETVDGNSYERVFELGAAFGVFRVGLDSAKTCLRLRVRVDDPDALFAVHRRVRKMFDLDADPLDLGERFAPHPFLGPLWGERPGLRVARGWDPFEVSISTILGQLVSTTQGRALVRQLVESHGRPVAHPRTGEPVRLFPSAATLASADLAQVRTSQARKEAIRTLSRLVASGEMDLGGDVASIKKQLLNLPGVGPWTSEYIGLRALGDTDSFPGSDLVLKRALARCPGIELQSLRPWRAYAAAHLWAASAQK